jgi:hypothetical protein
VNEVFDVDLLLETLTADGVVRQLAEGHALTIVLHVSPYAQFTALDTILRNLVVLGVIASPTSSGMLCPPRSADIHVIIEVPNPVAEHDRIAAQRPRSKFASGRGHMHEGIARSTAGGDSDAAADDAGCVCEECVRKKHPGYDKSKGCLCMLPSLTCVRVTEVHVRAREAFVVSEQLRATMRLLRAFFTPLPDVWPSLIRGHPIKCPGRFLIDATTDKNDRPAGLRLACDDSDEVVLDDPALDGDPAEVLGNLASFLDGGDDSEVWRSVVASKRLLTYFLSFVARTAAFLIDAPEVRYNEVYLRRGSVLLEAMLRRSLDLSNRRLRSEWHTFPHQFIVLRGGTLQILSGSRILGYADAMDCLMLRRGRILPVQAIFDEERGDRMYGLIAPL